MEFWTDADICATGPEAVTLEGNAFHTCYWVQHTLG